MPSAWLEDRAPGPESWARSAAIPTVYAVGSSRYYPRMPHTPRTPRRPKTQVPDKLPDTKGDTLTEDDKSWLQFLEGKGFGLEGLDPLSDEALRLQALYVQEFSQHPLDILRRIMQNPYADVKDRMKAADTILAYSLRKPAQQLAINAKGAGVVIDPSKLSGLSAEELGVLEQLLAKVV